MCRACMGWTSMNDLLMMDKTLVNNPDSFKRWHAITIICLITSKYDNGDYFHPGSENTNKKLLATSLLERYLEWKVNNLYDDDVNDDTDLYNGNPSPEYVARLIEIYKK